MTRRSHPGRLRPRCAGIAVAALVAAMVAAGCSSTPAGEASRPEGLAEQREILAERRAETRSTMDQALLQPSMADQAADVGSGLLDWLGGAAGSALDVLSLQAFGVW